MLEAVSALKKARAKPYDLIRVDCTKDGNAVRRHAMMFANAGFSTAALATPLVKRLLGGKAAYNLAIFLKLWVHRSPLITFKSPGVSWQAKKWTG